MILPETQYTETIRNSLTNQRGDAVDAVWALNTNALELANVVLERVIVLM
jgi:hypothetical protein